MLINPINIDFEQNGMMSTEDIIMQYINEFNMSQQKSWMQEGQKYYDAQNDILQRQTQKMNLSDGTVVEDPSKANNKLVHPYMKNMVDEKCGYLLSRPFSLSSKNSEYVQQVQDVLGTDFQYDLNGIGIESSNKGIAFVHVYIDEAGTFRYMLIPAEQCIPIWKDSMHKELEALIRVYIQETYQGREKKDITKVEFYTVSSVMYYELNGDTLIPDIQVNPSAQPIPHFYSNGEGKSWGRVPFAVFKNNRSEFPDLRYVKSLIDDYDLRSSDISNDLDECINFIYILRNYGGQNLKEFMSDMKFFRAIKTDSDGGVDTLTPHIDTETAQAHLERTKRDIKEMGQSVDMDLDQLGSAPSGVALKFVFAGLDEKAENFAVELKRGFRQLLYFVNMYLSVTGKGNYDNESVDITFNKDIAVNEVDTIANCKNSQGMISQRTIIANHPWVSDVDAEIAQMKAEQNQTK